MAVLAAGLAAVCAVGGCTARTTDGPGLLARRDIAVYVKADGLWQAGLGSNTPPVQIDREGRFRMPIISPDGKRVAYYRDDSLCAAPLHEPDALIRKVADAAVCFAWLDDERLAYSGKEGGLYVFDAAQNETQTLEEPGRIWDNVAVGSHGRLYASLHTAVPADGAAPMTCLGVGMMDTGTGETAILAAAQPAAEGTQGITPHVASISPDGAWLYIWNKPASGNESADGAPLAVYDTDKGTLYSSGTVAMSHADNLSPKPSDGGVVALVSGAGRDMARDKQLVLLDVHTQSQQTVTPKDDLAMTPAFSAGGQRLLYAGSAEGNKLLASRSPDYDIYEMDMRTGKVQQLTQHADCSDFAPRELSDRSSVVFVRRKADGVYALVRLDGIKEKEIDTGLMFGEAYYNHVDTSQTLDVYVRAMPE